MTTVTADAFDLEDQPVRETDNAEWLKNAVTTPELLKLYPTLFTNRRNPSYYYTNRHRNGLAEADAVTKSKNGILLWHRHNVLKWMLQR